jgi:small subunit ribosomal protein S24e
MELTIIEETEQPIFKRTHLACEATFEASVPSRGVVAQRLCEKRDVKPELVVIRTITSRFGGGTARIDAYVYTDAETLKRLEAEHLLERTAKTTAQPVPEPAVEETPEEAVADTAESEEEPAEEKKDSA